jgi:hypothetical protein
MPVKGTLLTMKLSSTSSPETIDVDKIKERFPNHFVIGFDILSSFYFQHLEIQPHTEQLSSQSQLPAGIRALNKKKVVIKGFAIPVKLQRGYTSEFLLVKDHSMCCFGRMPRMNEWISVAMPEGCPLRFSHIEIPLHVAGVLEVGEQYIDGELISIYRLAAESVSGPLDF